MRAVLSVFVVAACGSTPKPRVMPPPPEVVAKQAAPRWPVAMRVMTWTHDGVVQVGTLPEAPPTQPPATPWYVEPVRPMDDATFARLVVAMRRERVPGLSLRGQPVTAAWLAQLVDLDVTALVLDETDIDAAALAEIQLPLTRLYLARTRVDDAAMRWVATHPLEVIDIEGCAVGDVGLAALAEIATLRALNASSTRITDAGGAMLGKLARLEVVDLGRTEVGIKTIEALASRALSQLFVDKTRVGKAIAKLAAMAPTLVRFDASSLSGYRPTDVDVAWLA
ncbi:MAG TPA: hypothetical protein VK427_21775, partial [Kofleriaceae bacterium]|nr:hypothetical protein [Kofleriaceae bacterium]